MEYKVNINGIDVEAEYKDENIRDIFIPLLKKLSEIQKKKNGRVIAFLAAPPGAGKSTLASFLQYLSVQNNIAEKLQVIGMDGFHRRHEFLKTHSMIRDGKEIRMVDVKGAPETFDIDMLTERLKEISSGELCGWPVYDRLLHDAVDNAIIVDSDMIILEGNYLLLTGPGWNELSEMADYTVFVRADEDLLRERLVSRRIESGHGEADSVKFVEFSDMYNVKKILDDSKKADLMLELGSDGSYSVLK